LKGTIDKNIKAVLEEMYGASEERIQREELFGNDRLFVWTGIKWKNTKKS
jgi:hypothetical protein